MVEDLDWADDLLDESLAVYSGPLARDAEHVVGQQIGHDSEPVVAPGQYAVPLELRAQLNCRLWVKRAHRLDGGDEPPRMRTHGRERGNDFQHSTHVAVIAARCGVLDDLIEELRKRGLAELRIVREQRRWDALLTEQPASHDRDQGAIFRCRGERAREMAQTGSEDFGRNRFRFFLPERLHRLR
jgi:hypothetical protein